MHQSADPGTPGPGTPRPGTPRPGASAAPHPAAASRAARGLRVWGEALAAVLLALLAMTAVAALGLWSAHARELPGGAFPSVLAATVLTAVGVPVELTGSAAFVAQAHGGITVLPLSVTLVGALVLGAVFLRPLRLHAVVPPGELAGRAARTALLWAGLVLLLRLPAQHTFTLSTGDQLLDELGGAFGGAPTVGFRTEPLSALAHGLLWVLVVLALTLLASRRAPLPTALLRYQAAVRPAGHAVLVLLLGYVLLGLVAGLASAATDGHARDTFSVLLLGLPNLAWLALGLGLGGSWHGHVSGALGLPMPEALAAVLKTSASRDVTLDVSALAQQDGRAWLLPVLAAVLLLVTGFAAARRSPPGLRVWQHAVHLAVALAAAALLIGLLTRITASYGLSLLGLGGSGGISLQPDLLVSVPLAALWGAVAGAVGGALAARVGPDRGSGSAG
ncbi:streptophobe family protein [Kitasatospora kazusensis]|uniref:Streptophobe family protein n=1 Tax=Kitasatospora kazusensis TaxID=407974 RepID=A0ABN2ZU59_9ACTN